MSANRPTIADRLRDPDAHGYNPTRDDLLPPAAWIAEEFREGSPSYQAAWFPEAAQPKEQHMTDLTPGSSEWVRRISASKVAPILGVSPWDSPRAMWLKMKGLVPWDEETEAMERGTLCEPAVLNWWRKHHEHTDWREQVTVTIDDWCVATPDGIATQGDELVMIEAKTTADIDHWGTPGTDEVPLHYLAQIYMAMHVCHLNGLPVARTHVPVLGGRRFLFSNFVVPYSAEHGAAVLEKCREFYDSLAADEPPELDDTVATYEAVRAIHPDIDRGAQVELTREQADDLVTFKHLLEESKRSARLAETTVLDAMGRAQYATHDGIRVARRQGRGESTPWLVVTAKPTDLTDMKESA